MANQATSVKKTGGEDIKNCINKRERVPYGSTLSQQLFLSKIKTEPLTSWSLSPHFFLMQKMMEGEVEEEVVSMVI